VELLSSLRRNWILASLLLLLTVAGTVIAFSKISLTYQAQSSVVLLAPESAAKTYGGNPYLAFNSTLNQTGDVVRYEANDVRTVDALAKQGYTSTYLVADAQDTAGPVLIVTVTGTSQAEVEHTLYGVTSILGTKLRSLQGATPPASKIRDVVITLTPKATPLSSKKARPVSVVAGLGLILTIGIPVLVDSARQRRNKTRPAPAPATDPQPRTDDSDETISFRALRFPADRPERPQPPREPGPGLTRPAEPPEHRYQDRREPMPVQAQPPADPGQHPPANLP
jgi:hypothetical protein